MQNLSAITDTRFGGTGWEQQEGSEYRPRPHTDKSQHNSD